MVLQAMKCFFVQELQCDTQQATRPKEFETIGNHGFPGNIVFKHANLLDRECLDAVREHVGFNTSSDMISLLTHSVD